MKKFLLVACVLLIPVLANATPISLQYQGNSFGAAIGTLISGSDRITAQAIIDFTGAGNYTATSWGLTVSTTAGPVSILNSTPGLATSIAQFSLDQFGNVLTWTLLGRAQVTGASTTELLFTRNIGDASGIEDLAMIDDTFFPCSLPASCAHNLLAPGQWTATTVPETSSLALLGTGLALGGFAWKRSRKLSA